MRRKGCSKLHFSREEWALPGSPSGMHDAFDMLSFALLFPPKVISSSFPEGGGKTASDPAVLKGGLHMKFLYPAGKYLLEWLAWGGYSLSAPTFNSEMEAAGPLGVFLLQNPSSGLRGMAACQDWAFGFPLASFILKMRCIQTTGQNPQSKSPGRALAHWQNR